MAPDGLRLPSRASWDEPSPASIVSLDDAGWNAIAAAYGGKRPAALRRCLDVLKESGARSVVLETRYIDLDYRSEYSSFYSRTFRSEPDSALRLHFFRAELGMDDLWRLPADAGYLGYIVLRPSAAGAVGRTMIQAPPRDRAAIRAAVTEEVSFFGETLSVTGVPFMQQDTQLGSCAHAAAWMCHYGAFRRGLVARQTAATFGLRTDPALGMVNALPSEGMTSFQLKSLMATLDLPVRVDVDGEREWGTNPDTLLRICRRYLDSGIPLLVFTSDHAFVLCGGARPQRRRAFHRVGHLPVPRGAGGCRVSHLRSRLKRAEGGSRGAARRRCAPA